MCDIQTQCPNCKTQYLVSPTQLSIAKGTVCCPKCEHHFNAYEFHSHLPYIAQLEANYESVTALAHHRLHERGSENALAIFERKIETSSLDLLSYLNTHIVKEEENLNFKRHPSFFSLQKNTATRLINTLVHLFLLVLNLLVFGIILSQFTNNNRDLKQQFPLLGIFSDHACSVVKCNNKINTELRIEATKIHQDYPEFTTITGKFVNYSHSSRTLPTIQVVTPQRIFSFTSKQYLPLAQQGKQHLQPQQSLYFRIDIPLKDANQQFKLQLKKALD